ncbi:MULTISPECIES: class I SAM-dependent methyltransferase [Methylobacterium]|uniref:class I SAM-dependent methyltransferase n=1 Tax=Methylobacterium TaxID=407 RepID=UPI0013EB9133|nr:class I SAM-dependent methyltransferase [Methylobacterium sp. DB0501]NGM36942.1 class I SAM-dependent methyltransferase [Methylobacterium sp. DB0501]
MSTRGMSTALDLIAEAFAPLPGRRLLDIGCGAGALVRALTARGARVAGLDPSQAALVRARASVPGADLRLGAAETLPWPDGAFDGAVFLNSLHHVPGTGMAAALREAARVTGPGRGVVVVEPLAEGSFFLAMRRVEDETAIRAEAAAALAACVAEGVVAIERDTVIDRVETVADLDAFLARVTAGDPDREAAARAHRDAVAADFRAQAERGEGGFVLRQPLRVVILRVAG